VQQQADVDPERLRALAEVRQRQVPAHRRNHPAVRLNAYVTYHEFLDRVHDLASLAWSHTRPTEITLRPVFVDGAQVGVRISANPQTTDLVEVVTVADADEPTGLLSVLALLSRTALYGHHSLNQDIGLEAIVLNPAGQVINGAWVRDLRRMSPRENALPPYVKKMVRDSYASTRLWGDVANRAMAELAFDLECDEREVVVAVSFDNCPSWDFAYLFQDGLHLDRHGVACGQRLHSIGGAWLRAPSFEDDILQSVRGSSFLFSTEFRLSTIHGWKRHALMMFREQFRRSAVGVIDAPLMKWIGVELTPRDVTEIVAPLDSLFVRVQALARSIDASTLGSLEGEHVRAASSVHSLFEWVNDNPPFEGPTRFGQLPSQVIASHVVSMIRMVGSCRATAVVAGDKRLASEVDAVTAEVLAKVEKRGRFVLIRPDFVTTQHVDTLAVFSGLVLAGATTPHPLLAEPYIERLAGTTVFTPVFPDGEQLLRQAWQDDRSPMALG
jgi:hypothetical protein